MTDLWAYAIIQLGVVVFCAVGTFVALRLADPQRRERVNARRRERRRASV